jgi:hypothetical protein
MTNQLTTRLGAEAIDDIVKSEINFMGYGDNRRDPRLVVAYQNRDGKIFTILLDMSKVDNKQRLVSLLMWATHEGVFVQCTPLNALVPTRN